MSPYEFNLSYYLFQAYTQKSRFQLNGIFSLGVNCIWILFYLFGSFIALTYFLGRKTNYFSFSYFMSNRSIYLHKIQRYLFRIRKKKDNLNIDLRLPSEK